MSQPLRALTNDANDCKLIKLDPEDPTSAFVVLQEGYVRSDPTCKMRVFYLQRDGAWIEEVARSTRPEDEIGDIVFDQSAEAIQTLSQLSGDPVVREIPVTEADIRAYMDRVRGGTATELLRQFLARYRATKGTQ